MTTPMSIVDQFSPPDESLPQLEVRLRELVSTPKGRAQLAALLGPGEEAEGAEDLLPLPTVKASPLPLPAQAEPDTVPRHTYEALEKSHKKLVARVDELEASLDELKKDVATLVKAPKSKGAVAQYSGVINYKVIAEKVAAQEYFVKDVTTKVIKTMPQTIQFTLKKK